MQKIENVKKRKNVYKVLFIVSVSLVVAITGLFSFLLYRQTNQKNNYANAVQNGYTRNFTELASGMNEIDVNLSKLLASSTNSSRQKILLTIWRDCSACQTNLSALPLDHESVSGTLSFVNKLGEYCYYLSNKLIEDETFSTDDFVALNGLSDFSNLLNHDISLLALNVANGNFEVLKTFNGSDVEGLSSFLESIKQSTVETPSMIYDGPYSDAQDSRDIKGLSQTVCTADEAKVHVSSIFDVDANNITYTGETAGAFQTYNFEFEDLGVKTFAQITKQGKFLLQFNKEVPSGNSAINKDEAIEKGKAFFQKLEINNMEANWVNITDDEILINFAPVENGILIYSDLIKIKVSKANGTICGYEAVSFAYNHTTRPSQTATFSESEAREILSDKLFVENSRLCIIPKEFGEEVLAHEFMCSYNSYTYYVYINANTGKEEEIFRVVQDENEGELVL